MSTPSRSATSSKPACSTERLSPNERPRQRRSPTPYRRLHDPVRAAASDIGRDGRMTRRRARDRRTTAACLRRRGGVQLADQTAAKHVEYSLAAREVAMPDVHDVFRRKLEHRPRIQARPQPQVDWSRSPPPRATQRTTDPPQAERLGAGFFEEETGCDFGPFAACVLAPPIGQRVEPRGVQRDHAGERAEEARLVDCRRERWLVVPGGKRADGRVLRGRAVQCFLRRVHLCPAVGDASLSGSEYGWRPISVARSRNTRSIGERILSSRGFTRTAVLTAGRAVGRARCTPNSFARRLRTRPGWTRRGAGLGRSAPLRSYSPNRRCHAAWPSRPGRLVSQRTAERWSRSPSHSERNTPHHPHRSALVASASRSQASARRERRSCSSSRRGRDDPT
jgi:hypothetical protein